MDRKLQGVLTMQYMKRWKHNFLYTVLQLKPAIFHLRTKTCDCVLFLKYSLQRFYGVCTCYAVLLLTLLCICGGENAIGKWGVADLLYTRLLLLFRLRYKLRHRILIYLWIEKGGCFQQVLDIRYGRCPAKKHMKRIHKFVPDHVSKRNFQQRWQANFNKDY